MNHYDYNYSLNPGIFTSSLQRHHINYKKPFQYTLSIILSAEVVEAHTIILGNRISNTYKMICFSAQLAEHEAAGYGIWLSTAK